MKAKRLLALLMVAALEISSVSVDGTVQAAGIPATTETGIMQTEQGTQAGGDKTPDFVQDPATDIIVEEHYDNGTEQGVTWKIDANGNLTIRGTGEYELKKQTYFYDSETQWEQDMPAWYAYKDFIKTATVSLTDIKSTKYMFMGCTQLVSVDLNDFDTSQVTNMNSMFEECKCLENVVVSGLKTSSVTAMYSLFAGCSSLQSLDLSGWDTRNVCEMGRMFCGCSKLERVDVSSFDTGKVTGMDAMFYGCKSLQSVDVSKFKTQNVSYISRMFEGCSSLESLDVSGFDTSSAFEMAFMFKDCSLLKQLDVHGFSTKNAMTTNHMFDGCSNLKSLNLSGFDLQSLNAEYLWQFDEPDMFVGCTSLTEIYAPIHLSSDFPMALPKVDGAAWYRTDTNKQVEELPSELAKSIKLVRKSTSSSEKHTVTFYPLNGDAVIVKSDIVSGKTASLPKVPKREGYTFGGWFTEENGEGMRFTAKTKITEDISVYAKWIENVYNISFNKNGGKIVNTIILAKQAGIGYTANYTLPGAPGETKIENVGINKELIYRDGYILTGWNTKAKGNKENGIGTHYELGANVSKLTAKNKGTVTLYAEWTPIVYTITYILNDNETTPAANAPKNPDTRTVAKAVALKKPTRDGYTFGGWFADEALSVKAASIKKTVLEDTTVYAKWTENTYSIAYNKNGGVIVDKDAVAKKKGILYTADVTLAGTETMTRNGYVFAGWNTRKNGTGTAYAAGANVSRLIAKKNGTVMLYAQWTKAE